MKATKVLGPYGVAFAKPSPASKATFEALTIVEKWAAMDWVEGLMMRALVPRPLDCCDKAYNQALKDLFVFITRGMARQARISWRRKGKAQ